MPLVLHLPMDEDSGSTANDVTGNGNDGTITGATVGATGILGTTCYDFDGVDDEVTVSYASALGGRDNQVSVFAWINLDDISQGGEGANIFGSWPSTPGNRSYLFREPSSGSTTDIHVDVPYNSSSFDSMNFGDGVNFETRGWAHVGFTVQGNNLEGYVNGVKTNGITRASATLYSGGADFKIGYQVNADLWLDGRIDEIRVYDHALTAAEVAYLYNVTQKNDYLTSVKRA